VVTCGLDLLFDLQGSFRLELDVHGLFSITSESTVCMSHLLLLCVGQRGRVLVCPQGSERGSSRTFDIGYPSRLPFMEMTWLQINQSTHDSLVFPGA
jgi:hypothetical protein